MKKSKKRGHDKERHFVLASNDAQDHNHHHRHHRKTGEHEEVPVVHSGSELTDVNEALEQPASSLAAALVGRSSFTLVLVGTMITIAWLSFSSVVLVDEEAISKTESSSSMKRNDSNFASQPRSNLAQGQDPPSNLISQHNDTKTLDFTALEEDPTPFPSPVEKALPTNPVISETKDSSTSEKPQKWVEFPALIYDDKKVLEEGIKPEIYHEMQRHLPESSLSQYESKLASSNLHFKELCFDSMKERVMVVEAGIQKKIIQATALYARSIGDQPRAHFVFNTVNLVGAIRQARVYKEKYPRPTIVILETLKFGRYHTATPLWERKLLGYYLSQVDQVIALDDYEIQAGTAVCFSSGVIVPVPSFHLLEAIDFKWLRASVSQFTKRNRPLYETCTDLGLTKPVVWILNRRVYSRKMVGIEKMIELVQSLFREVGHDVVVNEFESPNIVCSSPFITQLNDYPFPLNFPGDPRGAGCGRRDIEFDIAAFNNISFIIAIHGGGLMNSIFHPVGAVVVEIHPYGVADNSYSGLFTTAGFTHLHYYEEDDRYVVDFFKRKMSKDEVWLPENRGKVKSLPVEVNLEKFRPVLERARDALLSSCFGKKLDV